MNVANIDYELLLNLVEIAEKASAIVMKHFNADSLATQTKSDNSPVTAADMEAHAYIVGELKNYSNAQIVSEEDAKILENTSIDTNYTFLVDPLDGTKEFIRKDSDFTVNIGLLKHGTPVAGVVCAPAQNLCYFGAKDVGAWKKTNDRPPEPMHASQNKSPKTIVVSKSHLDEKTEKFIKKYDKANQKSVGSSLKMCLVASGEADLYPRMGPQMEWDTAAADAVVRAAGGVVTDLAGQPLAYQKPEWRHHGFLCSNGLVL